MAVVVVPEMCTRYLAMCLNEVRAAILEDSPAAVELDMFDLERWFGELQQHVETSGWTQENRAKACFLIMDCAREVLLKRPSYDNAFQIMMRLYVFIKLLPM